MKRNKILYIIALIFYAVIPLAIFFMQYTPNDEFAPVFKISIGSIVVLIFLILAVRRIFLKRIFEELQLEMTNLKAQYIATPSAEVRSAWVKRKIILLIVDSIPLLLGGLCFVLISKGLESQLIELSGTLSFILMSIGAGLVFDCLSVAKAK